VVVVVEEKEEEVVVVVVVWWWCWLHPMLSGICDEWCQLMATPAQVANIAWQNAIKPVDLVYAPVRSTAGCPRS
jgi:hypothetical protein